MAHLGWGEGGLGVCGIVGRLLGFGGVLGSWDYGSDVQGVY